MKPKNEFQRSVVKINGKMPKITKNFSDWAYRCCKKVAAVKKDGVTCLECNAFHPVKNYTEETFYCPTCKNTVDVIKGKSRTYRDSYYLSYYNVYGTYQVIRYFFVEKRSFVNKPVLYSIIECVRIFMDEQGSYEICALPKMPFSNWLIFPFVRHGAIELRSPNHHHYISTDFDYKKGKVLPIIRRNGYEGFLYNYEPFAFFSLIVTDNCAETLLKTKQIPLFNTASRDSVWIEDHWHYIKMCFKQKYLVQSPSLWRDYLTMAKSNGYNLENPSVVCPANLREEHDKLLLIRHEKQKANDTKRMLEVRKKKRIKHFKLLARERLYHKKSKIFKDLVIKKKNIVIKPLLTIGDFRHEADMLKHCVYKSRYYQRKDSLILSASVDNVKMETIEYSLSQKQVVQCRGMRNESSNYHDQILDILKINLPKLKFISYGNNA